MNSRFSTTQGISNNNNNNNNNLIGKMMNNNNFNNNTIVSNALREVSNNSLVGGYNLEKVSMRINNNNVQIIPDTSSSSANSNCLMNNNSLTSIINGASLVMGGNSNIYNGGNTGSTVSTVSNNNNNNNNNAGSNNCSTVNNLSNTNSNSNSNTNSNCNSNSSSATSSATSSRNVSPHADRLYRHIQLYCSEIAGEISEVFFNTERLPKNLIRRDYLTQQPEVTEKMRAIVVDWLIDVIIKFKLHPESFYLAVNVMDRYLSIAQTTRVQLQLVGITSLLIAAKYEEMWAPDVRECIKITANTYTREEVLKMERAICGALSFRLTVPTPYVFVTRLLQVIKADTVTVHATFFFLEHATMDYQMLQFPPSLIAASSVFVANLLLATTMYNRDRDNASATANNNNGDNKVVNNSTSNTYVVNPANSNPSASELWNYDLSYYGRCNTGEIKPITEQLLKFCLHVTTAKYQAVRRKYSTPRMSEISLRPLPLSLPSDM